MIVLIIIPACLALYLFFASLTLKDTYNDMVLNYGKKILGKFKLVSSSS